MLNGVDMVRCRVNVPGPLDTPTDPEDIPFWLNEMEGQMRKSLAELRVG